MPPCTSIANHRSRGHGRARLRNGCLLSRDGTGPDCQRVDRRLRLLLREIHQKELAGEEKGRLSYLWLIINGLVHALWALYLECLSVQKVTSTIVYPRPSVRHSFEPDAARPPARSLRQTRARLC